MVYSYAVAMIEIPGIPGHILKSGFNPCLAYQIDETELCLHTG